MFYFRKLSSSFTFVFDFTTIQSRMLFYIFYNSFLTIGTVESLRSLRLGVRTAPFHGVNVGSIPTESTGHVAQLVRASAF